MVVCRDRGLVCRDRGGGLLGLRWWSVWIKLVVCGDRGGGLYG